MTRTAQQIHDANLAVIEAAEAAAKEHGVSYGADNWRELLDRSEFHSVVVERNDDVTGIGPEEEKSNV